ncbi:MAG TPA: amidohydrolase family protein, partial [Acidimicrobiales bacterium]
AAAVHSVRAVAPEEMEMVGRWAEERDTPLHAHVSEQPAENDDCTAAYGRTPVEVLAAAGLVGRRFTAVHATHLTASDVAALGGGHVCFCPTTERDLADGIGPSAALVAAGAELCLGSDSHAAIDLFEEARAVELDARLATGVRGHHTAVDLLTAATAGGARSLGWPDAGHLTVGALADLSVIAVDGVRVAGAAPAHLVEAAVFAAGAPDVRHVMVGGRWTIRDGQHMSVPVPASLAEAIDAVWAAA